MQQPAFLRKFNVPLQGVGDEPQAYDLFVDGEFLSYFPKREYHNAHINVRALLVKSADLILLELSLEGTVNVQCDRCLDYFDQEVALTRQVYLQDSAEDQDDDRDYVHIHPDATKFNVAQLLYEYLHLAVPLQNIHPDDENGQSTCNPEMLSIIDRSQGQKDEEQTDPRWAKLQELKNKSN